MFFLRHVLPLIIVSVFTGYVIARLDFSSIGTGTAAQQHHEAAEPAGKARQTHRDPAATAPGDPVSGEPDGLALLAAPSLRREPASANYARRINPDIKEAVETWSAERFLDRLPARQEATPGNGHRVLRGLIAAEKREQAAASVDVNTSAPPATPARQAVPAAPQAVTPQAPPAGSEDASVPPAAAPKLTLTELLAARWARDGHFPSMHLPSLLTTCEPMGQEADCWSREHVIHTDGRRQTVKTKSLIQGFSGSDFAIEYRNMLIDTGQGGERWLAGIHYLGCAIKSRDRIVCESPGRSKRFTYSRITREQLASRFGLALLASADWGQGDEAALFLPSPSTRCEYDTTQLVCWTGTRSLDSGQGRSRVKTKSLIQNPRERTFVVRYRNLVTEAPGPVGWEADTHEVNCTLVGLNELVCKEGEQTRSYGKLNSSRMSTGMSTGEPGLAATNPS